jgi:elongator complex protein 3
MEFTRELSEKIEQGMVRNKKTLHQLKIELCKKYGMKRVPTDVDLFSMIQNFFPAGELDKIKYRFRAKATRTATGVSIVAVMCSPAECPHGRCLTCPGGPEKGTPQSYTGKEPAAMRAEMNDYDPYRQVSERLKQLNLIGHPTDKIDLIIMGGTFTSRSLDYQEWFVKSCFEAMNGKKAATLEKVQKANECSRHRCVGLTIETRPDWARLQHIEEMLRFGATRVELGVQHTRDSILEKMQRGHLVHDTIFATRNLKDSGFKVCYHLMPGLPGSSRECDVEGFREVFSNQDFRPDYLKIYPTLVLEGTPLFELWKRGEYSPLRNEEAAEVVADIMETIPEWVRIQRVERDIPSNIIVDGVKQSNLREIAEKVLDERGKKCRCIRYREVGHRYLKEGVIPEKIELCRREYDASGGEEIFLSFEDVKKDILVAYCRLRKPSRAVFKEIEGSALIRELKVLGMELEIDRKPTRLAEQWQHRGIGRSLVAEAEKIAKEEFQLNRIMVLSGVGVRNYFRNLGYRKSKFWMAKKI